MVNPSNMPTRRRGIEMMVLSATLVSTSGLIFRSFDDISVFEVVFFRSVALVLMMCGVIAWAYGRQSLGVIRNVGFWGVLAVTFF